MKSSKWIMIGITCVFVGIVVGVFFGRNTASAYIHVDKTIQTQAQNPTDGRQVNDGKIDINTASIQQLELLPGIGETIAQRIIDYRTKQGPFQTVEDLMNVNGIGESKLEQIKPYIKVDSVSN